MTFTPAQPVITFTDLTGASRASTSAVTTLSALFRVHPADATWYDITPLPFGFVSFTDTDGKKYVAFPANDIGEAGTGTGYTATFVRGVPADKHARELERDDGYGWFVDWEGTEVLYIEQCSTPGSCRWHRV